MNEQQIGGGVSQLRGGLPGQPNRNLAMELERHGVQISPAVNGFVISPTHPMIGNMHAQNQWRVAKDIDEALRLAQEILNTPFRMPQLG